MIVALVKNYFILRKLNIMTNLLKRLSLNLERRGMSDAEQSHSPSFGVTSSASFNDFSMHIGQEGKYAALISTFAALWLP